MGTYDADAEQPSRAKKLGKCCCGCLNREWRALFRCCCCCGWCCGVFVFVVVVAIIVAYARVMDAAQFTNIELSAADGTTFGAYFTAPASCNASRPCPVSLMWHEWGGLNEELIEMADMLSSQRRLAVLVPDLFRGKASPSDNIIYNIIQVASAPQDRMDADADVAMAWLQKRSEIDASRVISGPGFCFGGSQALIFSTRHDVAGTITLYGSNIKSLADASDEVWGKLGANDKLLGIYGELDSRPSPEEVKSFEARLAKRNLDASVKVYPDVGHAFVTKHAIDHPQDDGGAAKAAWDLVLNFLDKEMLVSKQRRRLQAAAPEAPVAPPLWRTDHWNRLAGVLVNQCAGE